MTLLRGRRREGRGVFIVIEIIKRFTT